MTEQEFVDLAGALAKAWCNGAAIIDQIETHPPILALALAAAVANELDGGPVRLGAGAAFRAQLADRALRPPAVPRVKMVCATCQSEDVVRDAWAAWDVDTQSWVLRGEPFDAAQCEGACDGETRIEEIAI